MKKFILGILLCLAIAVPSWFLVMFVPALDVIGAPVIAIIAGMILSLFIKKKDTFTDGIAFTSKKILQDCKSKSIMPISSSISKSSLAIWSRVFR